MSRTEIARNAWQHGEMSDYTYCCLKNNYFNDEAIHDVVVHGWITQELGNKILCENGPTIEDLFDDSQDTEDEIIDQKEFDGGGTPVYAEIAVTKDMETGQIINAAFYTRCNGLYKFTKTYEEAIKIAIKTADALKRGEDYPPEFDN